MHQRLVYLNGKLVAESKAKLPIYDTAIATGEVVVEVTRTFNQTPFRLEKHLRRLFLGIKELSINIGISPKQLLNITLKTLEKNLKRQASPTEWQIIHYVSRGVAAHFGIFDSNSFRPSVAVHCFPLQKRLAKLAEKYDQGVDLVIPHQKVIPADVLSPQIKSRGRLDYLIARTQTNKIKPGATGVLLNQQGELTEATGASFFLVKNGQILTAPSPKVLAGFTREIVFDLARKCKIPIKETSIKPQDAISADEIFITSTVICLLHARTFQAKVIGNGSIGPITNTIRSAFKKLVGVDFAKQAKEYRHMNQNKT